MAPIRRQRSSKSVAAIAGLVGSVACWTTLTFIGSTRLSARPASPPQVQMGVDIFGNYNIPQQQQRQDSDSGDANVVEFSLPLEIELKEGGGGDIFVEAIDSKSDAYAAGVRKGQQLLKVSSTFGDDMWNAQGVGMTQLKVAIASRFGGSIKLGFAKQAGGKQFKGLGGKEAEAKSKRMEDMFKDGEEELGGKGLWNIFR
eukprot:TRINITY_DN13308_c0_g1_i1.p1 TRINITY_DN13308_c0_g1~~TRINITY_DN13308_c0_g1_i1.p1  ORF type:complete len:200 (-),score=75.16 TRINITY_DN13308_c0_g1_i1:252-851(-)